MSSTKIFMVPFNNDLITYPDNIIEKYNEHIAEVYFPLPSSVLPNARGSLSIMDMDTTKQFSKYLVSRGIRPVAIFNSTWTPIEVYADEYIANVVDQVRELYEAGVTKLIVNNYYVIVSRVFEKAIPGLEIVASVNSRHDTPDKVLTHIGFTRPRSIYIDRSFNRKWNEFLHVTAALKALNVKSTILVNEGCLYNCPFKTDHDAQSGMASYHGEEFLKYTRPILTKYPNLNDTILELNNTLGCTDVYKKNPWYLLKSPIIRPEDLDKYLPHIDHVKIAGRNRSTEWIENVLVAYINRSYTGSLVDLLDAADMGDLDAATYMNKDLSGIMEMTSTCHKVCISCGKCKKFYDENCLKVKSTQVTEDDLTQSVINKIEDDISGKGG